MRASDQIEKGQREIKLRTEILSFFLEHNIYVLKLF